MPRTTKDVKKEELKNEKVTKKTTKKTSTSVAKSKTTTSKSASAKKTTKKTTKTTAKATTKKSTSTVAKKKTTKKVSSTAKKKELETNVIAEYYDLPYRYNETIVKILYQTPNILFVYWDISDEDKNKFIEQYGENFFQSTKPILKIFNLTKNYNFEVEIDDFANSWYINVNDADCDYKVELARKPISLKQI